MLRGSPMVKVGIDAIGFYTSPYCLDLKTLAEARGIDVNKFYVGLGQEKMAVIPPDEDVVTMAADAGYRVLKQIDPKSIDTLLFATESAIDQSKAAGMFVHRLLGLPERCRVLEIKQACYGATAAVQMALPMLRENPNKKILVIASDVARYGLKSKGESSQGGGAIALLLSQNPRILAIEPESGFYTEDLMDFWRPNYREEAIVDGQYSCEVYLKLVQKTWEQYTALSGRTLKDHAHICYHVPVPRLVEKAHQYLLKINNAPKLSSATLKEVLGPALAYGRITGNCYTAALYLSFLSLLENSPSDLSGKRIGFYSYGSGCIGEFFSGIVQAGYQDSLDKAGHQKMLAERQLLSQAEYENFYNFHYPNDGAKLVLSSYGQGRYRLSGIDQHKRLYEASTACISD